MSAQVTGAGSLSHEDAVEAVAFVAEVCPERPFWPQLPTLPGQALDAEGLRGLERFLKGERGGLVEALGSAPPPTPSPGLVAFEAALADGAFPTAEGLKGQAVGPLTLATCLGDQDLRPALTDWVARSAAAQAARLVGHGLPVQVWIDEPCLGTASAADAEEALGPVLKAVRDAGARAGLHCCATSELPLDVVLALAPDVFSFDAWTQLESFCGHAAAAPIVAQTQVAWGLVPTLESAPAARVLALRWREATTVFGPPDELAARSLFTASCGLANHTPDAARASFALARDLVLHLRGGPE